MNTENYEFANPNPKCISHGDSKIRAIALALNKSWEDVYKDLCELGLEHYRIPMDEYITSMYLMKNGWIRHGVPVIDGMQNRNVHDFLLSTDEPAIIALTNGEYTYMNNHVIYDIANCCYNYINVYFSKKKVS